MKKVFYVEDDENIREIVLYALKSGSFDGRGFENSSAFFEAAKKEMPDLVLLDIMLPDEDGLAILKKIRKDLRFKDLPVIMLTAKSTELDLITGLDVGADDYVTKPFSVLELISRIKAVLRRTSPHEEPSRLVYGDIVLDVDRHTVTAGGKNINLTHKEFQLLRYLLINTGIVLTREKIMETIWGFDFEGESRTVDVHIKTLRQKLGESGNQIATVRGVGYKMGE